MRPSGRTIPWTCVSTPPRRAGVWASCWVAMKGMHKSCWPIVGWQTRGFENRAASPRYTCPDSRTRSEAPQNGRARPPGGGGAGRYGSDCSVCTADQAAVNTLYTDPEDKKKGEERLKLYKENEMYRDED